MYKKILFNFKSLINNYAKYEMFAIMLNFLIKYSINIDLLTITINNATFNNTLRKHFRNKIKEQFNYT